MTTKQLEAQTVQAFKAWRKASQRRELIQLEYAGNDGDWWPTREVHFDWPMAHYRIAKKRRTK